MCQDWVSHRECSSDRYGLSSVGRCSPAWNKKEIRKNTVIRKMNELNIIYYIQRRQSLRTSGCLSVTHLAMSE